MKKLRAVSLAVLAITLSVSALWHGADWAIRANGILMLAAVFALVFSTVKLRKDESQS